MPDTKPYLVVHGGQASGISVILYLRVSVLYGTIWEMFRLQSSLLHSSLSFLFGTSLRDATSKTSIFARLVEVDFELVATVASCLRVRYIIYITLQARTASEKKARQPAK
ncbi:hypothetical protein EJ05DRAFT_348752 [Pseudovirgaria hyperparasitica]|uniref:Uncharacterized protein n=1 Tax=Pseudovirgaria hyperparasitica TaxID=470096 RepID=A0A6A6W8Y9_9PEZI|nr:uncharacterized protein EJ05DRAFT_348752 [Pseudovirgaria hyperparasitica]KAF2758356.1 hypothetical protein EJ05DRAFT_348752 [Pseudovirgaria hyperparasitica]